MATQAYPRGRIAELLLKDETNFGVAASGNYTKTPFYSHTLEEKQPYEDDNILGGSRTNDRDPLAPAPGLPTMQGNIVVPLDCAHLGHWLKGALGAPVTTGGTSDYVHTFSSGGEVLPHRTIECKVASALFMQYLGCLVNKLNFEAARGAGYDRVTAEIMGKKETKLTSTGGGTPATMVAREPVVKAIPIVKISSVAVDPVISCSAEYNNNAAAQNYIGSAYPAGHDLDAIPTFTGSLRIRMRDATIYDLAKAQGAQSLELLWQTSATRSLSLFAAAVRFEPTGVPIEGPGGIEQTFAFRAEQTVSAAMLVATLKGPVASY